MRTVRLTTAQLDRACGAVLGSAVGDALGAGYEFGSAAVGSGGPAMIGGGLGGFAPGEWTDDTSMAVAILEVAASGVDLRDESSLDRIASGFRAWFDTHPSDIGVQTRRVLTDAGPEATAAALTATAYDLHVRTGRTAGNGGLMRSSPVALARLDDDAATAQAARRIGELTHFDPRSGEACTLWSLAIRHAILHAEFDIRSGLAQLDAESAAYWTERLDEAEVGPPSRFTNNGWVVEALQAAWSAIVHTPVPHGASDGDAGMPCAHLPAALSTAIGIGHDTDTVGAIAGALLGARWGASAIPAHWRRMLHGSPGITGERLVELATLAARGGKPLGNGWPLTARVDYTAYTGRQVLARHPFDDGVWLGDVDALEQLPEGVSAVVSLCLLGREQVPPGVEHIAFRLIDRADPGENPHLEFVLRDAAATVASLRAEGHEVLVHCVAAESRTPAVGIAYALALGIPFEAARDAVCAALPAARPNAAFLRTLDALGVRGMESPHGQTHHTKTTA